MQLYLDGGKFLRQQGDFHVLQTDIRIQRNGRSVGTTDRCRYLYNPANHANNRIECDDTARGPLRGVVYTLNQKLFKESGGETQQMRCVQRCSRLVPKVLTLDVEEDNG